MNSVALPLFQLYRRGYLKAILFFILVFLFIFHLAFPFINYGDISAKLIRIYLTVIVFFRAPYEYISYVINLISISFWLFLSTFQSIPSCGLFIVHKINSFIFNLYFCFDLVILIMSLVVIEG